MDCKKNSSGNTYTPFKKKFTQVVNQYDRGEAEEEGKQVELMFKLMQRRGDMVAHVIKWRGVLRSVERGKQIWQALFTKVNSCKFIQPQRSLVKCKAEDYRNTHQQDEKYETLFPHPHRRKNISSLRFMQTHILYKTIHRKTKLRLDSRKILLLNLKPKKNRLFWFCF